MDLVSSTEKFDIVTTVAFLIGVPEVQFTSEKTTLKEDLYHTLLKNYNARLIRDISLVRVAIQKNFVKIFQEMQHDTTHMKSLTNTDLIPQDSVQRLEKADINLYAKRNSVNDFQIVLNKEMQSRIASCKSLFPDWIEWDYIRKLFIVPNGLKEEGIKEAASLFCTISHTILTALI